MVTLDISATSQKALNQALSNLKAFAAGKAVIIASDK